MHPDQVITVGTHHRAELLRQAAEHRRAVVAVPPAARSLRRRTGWWLVALGLRIAVGPARRRVLVAAG